MDWHDMNAVCDSPDFGTTALRYRILDASFTVSPATMNAP